MGNAACARGASEVKAKHIKPALESRDLAECEDLVVRALEARKELPAVPIEKCRGRALRLISLHNQIEEDVQRLAAKRNGKPSKKMAMLTNKMAKYRTLMLAVLPPLHATDGSIDTDTMIQMLEINEVDDEDAQRGLIRLAKEFLTGPRRFLYDSTLAGVKAPSASTPEVADFSLMDLGNDHVSAIAPAVASNPTVHTVVLSGNKAVDNGAADAVVHMAAAVSARRGAVCLDLRELRGLSSRGLGEKLAGLVRSDRPFQVRCEGSSVPDDLAAQLRNDGARARRMRLLLAVARTQWPFEEEAVLLRAIIGIKVGGAV